MIAIIAAVARNRTIGKSGRIPWRITGEQTRFRTLTTGHVVIMGRLTYEEIGHPLPGRHTIVVSSTLSGCLPLDGCAAAGETTTLCAVGSLKEACAYAERTFPQCRVFIAGGARLFAESLAFADVLYLTEIDADIDGDVFFPLFDKQLYTKTINETHCAELPYRYVTYTRQ